jgi:hypothetical protein
MYRALQSEAKPQWLSIAGGFIAGRLLVVSLLVYFDISLQPLLYYFVALFFVVSSVQWIASRKAVVEE